MLIFKRGVYFMPIQLKSKVTSYFVNLVIDFLLLIVPLVVIYHIKYGTLHFNQSILDFLPVYILSWLAPTIIGKKFEVPLGQEKRFFDQLNPYIRSFIIQIGLLSVVLYALKWYFIPRFILFGTLGSFFILEILVLSGSYFIPDKKEKKANRSLALFLLEFVVLSVAFLSIYYQKHHMFSLTHTYKSAAILIFFVWAFTGIFIHHFKIEKNGNYLKTLWPFAKTFLVQLAVLSFFAFNFKDYQYSRLTLLGTITVLAVFDVLYVTLYYLFYKENAADIPGIEFFKANVFSEKVAKEEPREKALSGKYYVKNGRYEIYGIRRKLLQVYLKDYPAVFTFLDKYLDLDKFDIFDSEVIHSANPYNVEVLPNEHFTLFINLHEVNDLRYINRYFIKVHEKLKYGGVYVGKFETYTKRHERFFNKYPHYLATIVYFFDFIWKRIFPKMPLLKKVYFVITKGRGRVLSKAEGLGRLYYCGFELIAVEEIGNFVYFISKKSKEPVHGETPSYGPLIKLKRYGQNGKIIHVYKFRTMHPYSEYLHDYMLELNGYSSVNDKIKNDFRITSWGRFLRKYWLDELPQIINLIKGDLALVGVRPFSKVGIKRFTPEHVSTRLKYKPGCIPPYVALRMQTIDKYEESEKIYLNEKKTHPYTTDIKYLSLALYNIVTKKIHSA